MKNKSKLWIISICVAFAFLAGLTQSIYNPLVERAIERTKIKANANIQGAEYWSVKWVSVNFESWSTFGDRKQEMKIFSSEDEAIAFEKAIQEAFDLINATGLKVQTVKVAAN